MRVSREKLIELARQEVESRAVSDDLLSAYLIGSVASGNPIIGGTADIDLILIHQHLPHRHREIHPLSEDFHFDITHHSSDLYSKPRELRIDPWLGPMICEPIFLYDPQHFFERAQAGVRGRFHRPDHVHARALGFLERARGMKANLSTEEAWVGAFLRSVLEGANAAASLAGFPAAGRRNSMILKARFVELEQPSLYDRFLHILGGSRFNSDLIPTWLHHWRQMAEKASSFDDEFSLVRQKYYSAGFTSLLSVGRSDAILWTLLSTWDLGIHSLQGTNLDPPILKVWNDVLSALGLSDENRESKNAELELFLDGIEGMIENWADSYGA